MIKQPPYVFGPNSKELQIRNMVNEDLQIFLESNDFTHCWAITLTLTTGEVNTLRKSGADIRGYFEYLLREYNISGTHILEYTRKGVEHLHGIFYKKDYKKELLAKTSKQRKKYINYFTCEAIGAQHMIKPIRNKAGFNGWLNYMVKSQVPITVAHYIQEHFSQSLMAQYCETHNASKEE